MQELGTSPRHNECNELLWSRKRGINEPIEEPMGRCVGASCPRITDPARPGPTPCVIDGSTAFYSTPAAVSALPIPSLLSRASPHAFRLIPSQTSGRTLAHSLATTRKNQHCHITDSFNSCIYCQLQLHMSSRPSNTSTVYLQRREVGGIYFWGGLWTKATPFSMLPLSPATHASSSFCSFSVMPTRASTAFSAPLGCCNR